MIFFFFSILKMCIHLLLKSFSIRDMICPFLLLTLTNLGTVMSSAPDNMNCPCTTKITRDAQIAILADSDFQFLDNSLVQHYILISKQVNMKIVRPNKQVLLSFNNSQSKLLRDWYEVLKENSCAAIFLTNESLCTPSFY